MSNMTGACKLGSAYRLEAPYITPVFCAVHLIQYIVFYAVYCVLLFGFLWLFVLCCDIASLFSTNECPFVIFHLSCTGNMILPLCQRITYYITSGTKHVEKNQTIDLHADLG